MPPPSLAQVNEFLRLLRFPAFFVLKKLNRSSLFAYAILIRSEIHWIFVNLLAFLAHKWITADAYTYLCLLIIIVFLKVLFYGIIFSSVVAAPTYS